MSARFIYIFWQSSERALAQSKTRMFLRPGERYAMRMRRNGNPCGGFSNCLYARVAAVRCRPCIVQLNFYSDQVSEDDNILYYDNRTGLLLLVETLVAIPGIQCKATNNRATEISGFYDVLVDAMGIQDIFPGVFGPIEDHCCQKETTLYVTRLPQSCSACACEEDVDCGPCCNTNTGCGCESVSGYDSDLSSLLNS